MQNSIQFDAHYIDCGDACIAYYTFGQGEPLVLLHGNGEGSEYFAKCIPYLSRFYRVIAVDSRASRITLLVKASRLFCCMAMVRAVNISRNAFPTCPAFIV